MGVHLRRMDSNIVWTRSGDSGALRCSAKRENDRVDGDAQHAADRRRRVGCGSWRVRGGGVQAWNVAASR